jgi:tetratricopeptide (TPR) repeat protein
MGADSSKMTSTPHDQLPTLQKCLMLSERGEFKAAESAFRDAIVRDPYDRLLLLHYALMKRLSDERDGAIMILDHAKKTIGEDDEMLSIRARIELERGGDAVPIYEALARAQPKNPLHLLGLATAHLVCGQLSVATEVLESGVNAHPGWVEGLTALSKLRWELGDSEFFDQDFLQSIDANPSAIELRFAHCGMLASGQHYSRLAGAVEVAREAVGDHRLFDMFDAQAAGEQGDLARAERFFAAAGPIEDYSFAAVRMRSLLRAGRPDEAEIVGQPFLAAPGSNFIWPLMALAWRQCSPAKWHWLEQFDISVKAIDLELPQGLCGKLASLVRRLHSGKAHPMDLSARGGTQTRLNLLERSESEIVELRQLLRGAVRRYIDDLPPAEPGHPFMGQPRGNFRFSGSWSIRLGSSGYHVSHVHPSGWISSAFYVAIPEALDRDHKEGWLAVGCAPAELGLDLPPMVHVQPKVGRLVLFPSIMWHGTEPFDQGERMSVAFDITPFGA